MDAPALTDETNVVNKIVYGNTKTMFSPVDSISQDQMLANLSRDGPDTAALEKIIVSSKEDNRILTEYLYTIAFKEWCWVI